STRPCSRESRRISTMRRKRSRCRDRRSLRACLSPSRARSIRSTVCSELFSISVVINLLLPKRGEIRTGKSRFCRFFYSAPRHWPPYSAKSHRLDKRAWVPFGGDRLLMGARARVHLSWSILSLRFSSSPLFLPIFVAQRCNLLQKIGLRFSHFIVAWIAH